MRERRWLWIGLLIVGLGFVVGLLVLPAQFQDGRDTELARGVERSGADPQVVVEVEIHVGRARFGLVVDEQFATYRTPSGTAVARLHAFDPVPGDLTSEGVYTVGPGPGMEQVVVSPDGRDGFFVDDYESALRGQFRTFYAVTDALIGASAMGGLMISTRLAAARARRRGRGRGEFLLVAAAFCVLSGCFVMAMWGLSWVL